MVFTLEKQVIDWFFGYFYNTKKNELYASKQKLYLRFWRANLCSSKMLLQSMKNMSVTLMEMFIKIHVSHFITNFN